METKSSVFLAFQGGGAKGVVHAGALLAVNELGLDIKGVSGTSAGSMIAALIAAGYNGVDLVDPINESHLFETITPKFGIHRATDIFSESAWTWLKRARQMPAALSAIQKKISKLKSLPLLGHLLGKPGAALAASVFLLIIVAYPLAAQIVTVVSIAAWLGAYFLAKRLSRGVSSVVAIRRLIDGAIAHKMGLSKQNVTFRDLADAGGIPLKIVATNVSGECLELFCNDRTPDTPIADAVAASVCLPIIFIPWRFHFRRITETMEFQTAGTFFDGGLMSNLPAWPFDEERLLFPEATTIALGIGATEPKSQEDNAKHWLSSIINAIVSGTGEIHTRAVGKIIKIPLKCELTLLEFDAPISKIYEEVIRSRDQVKRQLRQELTVYPRLMKEATNTLQAAITAILKMYEGRWYSEPLANQTIRVALATQRSGAMNTLSLVYSAGYTHYHPDSRLTLPLSGSFAGAAWKEGSIVATAPFSNDINMHAKDKIWEKIQWVMCIPVYPPSMKLIVPVEGDSAKPPMIGKTGNEIAKTRPFVIVIDGTMPFDDSLENAAEELVECLERIEQSAVKYLQDKKLDQILQGSNSWL